MSDGYDEAAEAQRKAAVKQKNKDMLAKLNAKIERWLHEYIDLQKGEAQK